MPAYPIWAYYAHRRQHRCQEDPVSLPFDRLEKTTRSSSHHVAQQRPTGSKTTPPYSPRSSRFGSEPPSVEDDFDIWCYAIVRVACQKRRWRRAETAGKISFLVLHLFLCLPQYYKKTVLVVIMKLRILGNGSVITPFSVWPTLQITGHKRYFWAVLHNFAWSTWGWFAGDTWFSVFWLSF